MDRTRPRTATSEDVTSTAQIAICTASRTSRSVKRRSPPTPAAPVRITCQGSERITCRTGTIPNSRPLANASPSATRYVPASGLTGTLMGILGMGCHALNKRRITTPPARPSTPPASETRTASVSILRRIKPLRDPSARRSAVSLARSAVRAANRLPRLAHAASRMSPASSISPPMNARAGPCSISPIKPGWAKVNFTSSSSDGYVFESHAARIFRSAAACAAVTPGFSRPTINAE